MKPLDFLRELLACKGFVTSWHWNDDFFAFWDRFYKGKSIDQARSGLSYYMRTLVKCGGAYPSKKIGIGEGGVFDYGVNYQTIWNVKNLELRKNWIRKQHKGT